MIRLVTTRGHDYTVAHVRRDRRAPALQVIDYDRLIRSRRFPRVPHVFTDLDRLPAFDLELAAIIHHRLRSRRIPVYNDPARVKTRFALLRALHASGVNVFNAYRLDEGLRPERYPVFLRRESGHGKLQSDLLPDWDAARRAIDTALEKGIPVINLILVEYAAEPVRPGVFRKYALWRRVPDQLGFGQHRAPARPAIEGQRVHAPHTDHPPGRSGRQVTTELTP
jgi:hypothetical protein